MVKDMTDAQEIDFFERMLGTEGSDTSDFYTAGKIVIARATENAVTEDEFSIVKYFESSLGREGSDNSEFYNAGREVIALARKA